MKKRQAWLLPLVFLLGYLCAWAMITVDRQMLIEEQRRLQDEVKRVRIKLKIAKMIDEYNEDYGNQLEWNIKAMEEMPDDQVGK